MRKNKYLLYGILFVPKSRIKKVKNGITLRRKEKAKLFRISEKD
jgi:hypothetical protein